MHGSTHSAQLESAAPVRVFLTSHDPDAVPLGQFRQALEDLAPRYRCADAASRADVIIYFEPGYNKFRRWTKTLLADETIRAYPEKCFVHEFSDRPVAFMPGIYVFQSALRLGLETDETQSISGRQSKQIQHVFSCNRKQSRA